MVDDVDLELKIEAQIWGQEIGVSPIQFEYMITLQVTLSLKSNMVSGF